MMDIDLDTSFSDDDDKNKVQCIFTLLNKNGTKAKTIRQFANMSIALEMAVFVANQKAITLRDDVNEYLKEHGFPDCPANYTPSLQL